MSFTITCQCFIKSQTDLIIDTAGNIHPAKTVTFCKKKAFIITEDGDIVCQAADENFNFLMNQVGEVIEKEMKV